MSTRTTTKTTNGREFIPPGIAPTGEPHAPEAGEAPAAPSVAPGQDLGASTTQTTSPWAGTVVEPPDPGFRTLVAEGTGARTRAHVRRAAYPGYRQFHAQALEDLAVDEVTAGGHSPLDVEGRLTHRCLVEEVTRSQARLDLAHIEERQAAQAVDAAEEGAAAAPPAPGVIERVGPHLAILIGTGIVVAASAYLLALPLHAYVAGPYMAQVVGKQAGRAVGFDLSWTLAFAYALATFLPLAVAATATRGRLGWVPKAVGVAGELLAAIAFGLLRMADGRITAQNLAWTGLELVLALVHMAVVLGAGARLKALDEERRGREKTEAELAARRYLHAGRMAGTAEAKAEYRAAWHAVHVHEEAAARLKDNQGLARTTARAEYLTTAMELVGAHVELGPFEQIGRVEEDEAALPSPSHQFPGGSP